MLQVQNISYAYDTEPVLHDVSLTVKAGEIVCLLGASGCGKTTLMRIIAGLETGYSGDVSVNDLSIKTTPIHQRGFGLMFQDFALFPHKNVADNVAFGLRMQGKSRAEQQQITDDVLALVGLEGYNQRDVGQLSGGEKQRVALARSLAPQPRLLMLDEPLGSLDAGLRERLVLDLRRIIKRIGLTALYVTHDQQEAYVVADRIAVMNAGRIEQIDSPQALYRHPRTQFVANFLGFNNFVSGHRLNQMVGADLLLLHPDGIHLAEDGELAGRVSECTFRGGHYRLSVQTDAGHITFTTSQRDLPQVGEQVSLHIESKALMAIASKP